MPQTLNAKCLYFIQSLPFYKQLIAESKENKGVRIIGVFSNESEESEHYLREHDVDIEFIPNIDLVELKVVATPTVIWVDANRENCRFLPKAASRKTGISFS